MEADLHAYYQVDLVDLYRPGRRVTLRKVFSLVSQLPPESRVHTLDRGGRPWWSVEAHLLDDLRMNLTGSKDKPAKRHPGRPTPRPKVPTPQRARKLADARRRARERREALGQTP